ncbi:hypothetical protein P3S67_018700 [Capsicum chacoense]
MASTSYREGAEEVRFPIIDRSTREPAQNVIVGKGPPKVDITCLSFTVLFRSIDQKKK